MGDCGEWPPEEVAGAVTTDEDRDSLVLFGSNSDSSIDGIREFLRIGPLARTTCRAVSVGVCIVSCLPDSVRQEQLTSLLVGTLIPSAFTDLWFALSLF